MNRRIILALSRKQTHHYEPFANLLRGDFDFVEDVVWSPQEIERIQPAILLTPTDTWYEASACIQKAREMSIPTLLIMDGIIEWRHTWLDPNMGMITGVPLFQPVMTDKIACLGRQSVRLISSWGNVAKCELIGAPRLDQYLTQPVRPSSGEHPRIVLVATANTPGFTPHQIEQVEQSLADLRDAIQMRNDWRAVWRVKTEMKQKLNLQDNLSNIASLPLKRVLELADAIITTPSTLQLEAMLSKRPTALLDYSNSPHYVDSVWKITAPTHIDKVLDELTAPSYPQLMLQDFLLHDSLECQSPAASRMEILIRKMVACADECKAKGLPLIFPSILMDSPDPVPSPHHLAAAFPENQSYQAKNMDQLERDLAFAQQEIQDLRRQLKLEKILQKILRLLVPKVRV